MHHHWIKALWLSVVALTTLANCAGPYKGRLIEAGNGAPIPGVVVVGYWTNETPTFGGGATNCLDARETVSDEKGEFTIPTSSYGEIFGEMNVAICKVGYARMVRGPWDSLKDVKIWGNHVEWEGDRVIVSLERVETNRLMYEGEPPHVSCGRKDGKPLNAYIEVRKEYRRALGLKPYRSK